MCFCMYSMCGWQGYDKVKIGTKWTDFKKVIDFHEEIFNLNTYDLEHNWLYFYNVSSICKQTSPCCLHPDMAIYYSWPVSFGLPADFRPGPPWLLSQHTPWFVSVCLSTSFTIQTSTGSLVSMSVDHYLSKDSKLPVLWSDHFIPSLLLTGCVCK